MISFFKKDFLNELWLDFEKLLNIKNVENDFNIMPISGLLVSNLSKNDFFKNLESNLQVILNDGEESTETKVQIIKDSEDMNWIMLSDDQSFDLLSSIYTTINAINSHESIKNVIGVALKFSINFNGLTEKCYLIYRMDLQSFYPFAPTSNNVGDRNEEMERFLFDFLKSKKINLEKNKRNWLGLWGIPI